jgi:hypothetical protein
MVSTFTCENDRWNHRMRMHGSHAQHFLRMQDLVGKFDRSCTRVPTERINAGVMVAIYAGASCVLRGFGCCDDWFPNFGVLGRGGSWMLYESDTRVMKPDVDLAGEA